MISRTRSQVLTVCLLASLTVSRGFNVFPQGRKMMSLTTMPSDEDEIYNDFGDMVIGDGNGGQESQKESAFSLSSSSSLKNRFDQLVACEKENESKIEGNWQEGHWTIRGCSLDPGEGSEKTQISSLCSIDGTDVLLVGRTDGSICWLQLGEEFLATFISQLVAKEGGNNSIQVTEGLKREDSTQLSTVSSESPIQFEVLTQVKSNGGAVIEMVYSDPFLFSANEAGDVLCWEISEEGPLSHSPVLITTLPSSVVSLQVVEFGGRKFLLSVCREGQTFAWRLGSVTSPASSLTLSTLLEAGGNVSSFACDDRYCYFGTERGSVVVYNLESLLADSNETTALIVFSPFDHGSAGVSAISSTGTGIMSNARQQTVGLIVGGTHGKIKQYELIPRGSNALEFWPKLDSQTLPGKSHNFAVNREGPILALKVLPQVILAASSEGLAILNPASGNLLFGMHGLDFGSSKPSLVVQDSNSLLITNGMEQYVCLHDFSAEELDVNEMVEGSEED